VNRWNRPSPHARSASTHNISTTDFGLSASDASDLYSWGKDAAHAFFTDPQQQAYLNSFGKTVTMAATYTSPHSDTAPN
jgi:hypothetical protein